MRATSTSARRLYNSPWAPPVGRPASDGFPASTPVAPPSPNGARDKLHPEFGRDSAFVSRPKGRGGAKRSRVSDVSFIEQIGGAHGTEPSRAFGAGRGFGPGGGSLPAPPGG